MFSTIEINQLDYLPLNCLAILRDNLGSSDVFSLCLRANNLNKKSLTFKIAFFSNHNIPIYVLMIKSNHTIYKCLIGFNIIKEFEYFKNLMNLKSFNLFLISDKKEISIIRINNIHSNKFLDSLLSIKSNMPDISYNESEYAKQVILNTYSDNDLWNKSILK